MLIRIILALGFAHACTTPNPSELPAPSQGLATSAMEPAKPSVKTQKSENPSVEGSPENEFAGLSDGTLVGARCPTNADFSNLEIALKELGDETKNLVKDDLENLLKTSMRKDSAGITSCCNQVEQLVQDAEVMNEDRPNTEAALEKLHQLIKQLCPSRSQ